MRGHRKQEETGGRRRPDRPTTSSRLLRLPARVLSQLSRFVTGVEIHPAAVIGRRFFIDPAWEWSSTATVGEDVLMFHGSTLGGVSRSRGRRQPQVGDRVLMGAVAKVLGPISIGNDAKVGANAVLVSDLGAGMVAVGPRAIILRDRGVDDLVDPAIHIRAARSAASSRAQDSHRLLP